MVTKRRGRNPIIRLGALLNGVDEGDKEVPVMPVNRDRLDALDMEVEDEAEQELKDANGLLPLMPYAYMHALATRYGFRSMQKKVWKLLDAELKRRLLELVKMSAISAQGTKTTSTLTLEAGKDAAAQLPWLPNIFHG